MSLKEVLAQQKADRDSWAVSVTKQLDNTTRNANKRSDATVKALSGLSKTLGQNIIADEEERIEKAKQQGVIDAREKELDDLDQTGDDGIPQEEKDEDKKVKDYMASSKKAFDTASLNIQTRGGRFEDAYNVKSLAGWRVFAEREETARLAGQEYSGWLEGEMTENDELELVDDKGKEFTPARAETLEQKRIAMKALRQKFMAEQGLLGIKRTILSDEFYPSAITAHRALAKKYEDIDAAEKSAEDYDTAKRHYEGSKDFGQLLSSLAPLKIEGKVLGRAGALDKAFEIPEGLAEIDMFDLEDYKALGKQKVKIDGVESKVKDKWPFRYAELGTKIDEAITERYNNAIAKEKSEAGKAQLEVLKKTKDMEDEEVIPYLRKEQGLLQDKYPGFEFSLIDKASKNHAKGSAYLDQVGQAEEEMRAGTLTSEKLSKYSLQIQNDERFSKYAKQLDAALSGEQKQHIDDINTAVAWHVNEGGGDKKHPSVPKMQRYAYTKYRAFLATAISNNVPNPSEWASQATTQWLANYVKDRKNFNEDFYINIPGQLSKRELIKDSKTFNAEHKRQNDLLSKYEEKIFLPENINKLISKDKLTNSLADYLKTESSPTSFDYPGEIDTLYQWGDGKRSRFDIMNDVLQVSKLPTLGNKPPSIEKFDNNASKADNVTLWNKTFPSSSRVWGAIAARDGSLNLELIPNGLGEEMFKWSEDNSFEFGEMAGAVDFMTANPSIAFNYGLTEEDLGAFTMPPSTSGEVNWDRVGEAAGKFKLHMITRTQDIGRELMQTGMNMKDFFGDSYNMLGENVVDFSETINQIVESGVSDAMNADAGNILQEQLIDPVTQTPQILEDEASNAINNLINQYLGDVPELSDEDVCNYELSQYKTTGDMSHCPLRK